MAYMDHKKFHILLQSRCESFPIPGPERRPQIVGPLSEGTDRKDPQNSYKQPCNAVLVRITSKPCLVSTRPKAPSKEPLKGM